ncbi:MULTISPECIES: DUF2382 domain-containing protein [unclassified Coleofasciculus]|uniref:DUF2382 domain-containing protein n=1 Tax=unclassified Coleofasciculus TaxID=2692782 RepID=UPI00187FC0DA|nr:MULTISPECIES: DUF2382 domain-containing protein [unclassified Coleofasciculus]MBE9125510.1 DUF2382 domain-containing protein [Coleofasciculus sp. LEGE 07081]MBE9148626.1 DUF2382 domain-containing protein [Coleofasciculus sp. LEGE 07092]
MALVTIENFSPNYKEEIFGGEDIKGFDVYSEKDEKIGSVYDVLLDEAGRFRYLAIDMGFWVFGKKVLLPVGLAQMDYDHNRVYARGMTENEAKKLPEYRNNMTIDYNYEEQVRNAYRPVAIRAGRTAAEVNQSTYTTDTYRYDHEPGLYGIEGQEQKTLKLYEERLLTNKERHKAGEVSVGKRVESETAQVSVPIEKERVIIERTGTSELREVEPGSVNFEEGEVARVELYEESADIQKKAFVREEVGVKKEVERDTVDAKETLRREELEIDVEGQPTIRGDRAKEAGL